MAHLIDKSALVAEIERLKSEYMEHTRDKFHTKWACGVLDHILSFLNTLEVREVDLEKEINDWYNTEASEEFEYVLYRDIENCAKHFFELGMAVKALQDEPVSDINFEQELYKAFGQVKDFTLGMRIAKWFYDMGKKNQEPVSEYLEEACEQLAENARKHKAETSSPFFSPTDYKQGVIDGAAWQKQKDSIVSEGLEDAMQHNAPDNIGIDDLLYWRNGFITGVKWHKAKMMANTADATIGLPYENKDGGYTHLVDVSRPLPIGENKIAIIFKEN